MSVDFTPHAVYDVDIISEYLDAGRAGGGNRFQSALQQTLARLELFPESGGLFEPPSQRHPNLRVTPVSRFPRYAVYYRPTADGVLVVRVLHNSRNAGAIFGPDTDAPTPPGS